MTDEHDQLDPAEEIKLSVLADLSMILESLQTANNMRFEYMEKQYEELEKIFGTLFTAYSELAVLVEAILNRLAAASDDDRESIRQDIIKGREAMLDLMRRATQGGEEGEVDGTFTPYIHPSGTTEPEQQVAPDEPS